MTDLNRIVEYDLEFRTEDESESRMSDINPYTIQLFLSKWGVQSTIPLDDRSADHFIRLVEGVTYPRYLCLRLNQVGLNRHQSGSVSRITETAERLGITALSEEEKREICIYG